MGGVGRRRAVLHEALLATILRADRDESMRQSLFVVGLALLLAVDSGRPVSAQAPSNSAVRLAFVFAGTESSMSPGYTIDFWQRLRELGWIRGENVLVEERWANGDVDRMPALIAEVIARKVDVLIVGTDAGAIAAKKATSTIPIVAVTLGDPVGTGVATSLARPGGNLTGLSLQPGEGVPGKCLELLLELLPPRSVAAVLWDPDFAPNRIQVSQLEKEAAAQGIRLRLIEYRSWQGLERAFSRARAEAKGVLHLTDPLTYSDRRRVASLAARWHIPTIYPLLDFVNDGGLIAYGADFRVMYRRAAEYVDKVLRGAKPGELPIEQSTQLKLKVNLKAAQALGLAIPESILLRADDVIR